MRFGTPKTKIVAPTPTAFELVLQNSAGKSLPTLGQKETCPRKSAAHAKNMRTYVQDPE